MDDMTLLAAYIRDLRNMDVMMALDRLTRLPANQEEAKASLDDVRTIYAYINKSVPDGLREVATAMFIEHGQLIQSHLRQVVPSPESR